MATLSTSSLNWLANQWEDSYGSAVLSGIVGDLAHKARGGYHISRQDQPKTNYSVIRPDDKYGPSDRASAIDMTMSTADIIKCHKRLRECWKNRANDPRMKYINAWNGWDGEGDAGRYDVVKGTITTATSDHKWHIHLEIRRRYVNSMDAMRAILSMLRGETVSKFLGTDIAPAQPIGGTVATQFNQEDKDALKAAATGGVLGYTGGGLPYWEDQPTGRNFLNTIAEMFARVSELQEAQVANEAQLAAIIAKLEELTSETPPPPTA